MCYQTLLTRSISLLRAPRWGWGSRRGRENVEWAWKGCPMEDVECFGYFGDVGFLCIFMILWCISFFFSLSQKEEKKC